MRTSSALTLGLLLLAGTAVPAASAPLSATATLTLSLGSLPEIELGGDPVAVAVSSGTGAFVLPAGVISGSGTLPYELFTGVGYLISSLRFENVANLTLTQAGGAASGTVEGQLIGGLTGGLVNLLIPLGLGSGVVVPAGVAALAVTVTQGTGWTTGPVSVTGITTEYGAVGTTVFATGSDTRTAGHRGAVTLVTPTRVLSNAVGNLPLFGRLTIHFTPEPALLALLGAAALAVAGIHRRSRRR